MSLARESNSKCEWSLTMALDALESARSELGEVYVNYDDPDIAEELMLARRHIDRARAIVRGVDPVDVEVWI